MLSNAILSEINRAAVPLTYDATDYDPLLKWIGSRKLVLLGEASHGTHDFYRERAAITRRLIEEEGFNAIAIDDDWPGAHRVHRYLMGGDGDGRDALHGFERFPAWMWRNMDVLALVEWLHEFNRKRKRHERAGFYGLDLYSTHASMRAVLDYLDKVDLKGAQRARLRYSCFDHFGEDPQAYGDAATLSPDGASNSQVIAWLVELQRRRAEVASRGGRVSPQDGLIAEQNARLVQNAEHYYRAMFDDSAEMWNLRCRHMADTLDWIEQLQPGAKVVVWTHNAHAGDARATEMSARGEVNLGQLARERCGGDNVYLLGFTTHSGEVTAASAWDRPAERKVVRNALEGSYEAIFHRTQIPAFLLPLHGSLIEKILEGPMLERAIGVVYQPENEQLSQYFECDLPGQFDAIIHFDRTQALVPFERASRWEAGATPETYPYAV